MTTPVFPTWPTISTTAPRRPSTVSRPDDAQSPGAGVASDENGTDAFEPVQRSKAESSTTPELADPGEHGPVGDYLIATAESQQESEVTVVDRDRAIAAFTDIMRMQI